MNELDAANGEFLYRFVFVDYLVVFLYLAMLVSVGFLLKRFCSDSKNYFIGGHRVSWWFAGGSCFMASFSAWTFTGAAGFAYRYGIIAILVFFFNAISFIFLALYLADKCRQTRAITAMEIVRDRFGRAAEQVLSWVNMPMWIFGGAIWLNGFAMFVSVAFGMPIQLTIILSGVVILTYSTLGGSWAVVATDFLQSIILVVLVVVVAVLTLIKIGGPVEFYQNIDPGHFSFTSPDHDWYWIAAYFCSIFFGFTSIRGAPRFLCVKDGKSAKKVAYFAAFLFIVGPILWFLPPMAASHFYPNIAEQIPGMSNPHEGAYVLMGLSVLPKGLAAVLVMVVFGATLSSMDTAMTQNSAILAMNIYKPVFRPQAKDKELFLVGRIFNVLFGISVLSFSLFIANQDKMDLFDLNVFLASTLGLSMTVPFFLLYWVKKAPKCAALISIVAGLLYSVVGQHGYIISEQSGCVFCEYLHMWGIDGFDTHQPWSLQYRVFGVMIFGGGAFMLTTLFWRYVKPQDKKQIEEFYIKMDTPIDVEKEVAGAEDMRQLVIIGAMLKIVGLGLLLLLFVSNPWDGRVIIAATGLSIAGIGQFFYKKGKKSEAEVVSVSADEN
jgi:solute:Na+ symporter, SSS family